MFEHYEQKKNISLQCQFFYLYNEVMDDTLFSVYRKIHCKCLIKISYVYYTHVIIKALSQHYLNIKKILREICELLFMLPSIF